MGRVAAKSAVRLLSGRTVKAGPICAKGRKEARIVLLYGNIAKGRAGLRVAEKSGP